MDKVYPQRRLGDGNGWGRDQEARLNDMSRALASLSQKVDNLSRGNTAHTNTLQQNVRNNDRTQQQIEEINRRLTNVSDKVIVIGRNLDNTTVRLPSSSSAHHTISNFSTPAGVGTVLNATVNVPAGKTRATITIQALLRYASVGTSVVRGYISIDGVSTESWARPLQGADTDQEAVLFYSETLSVQPGQVVDVELRTSASALVPASSDNAAVLDVTTIFTA